jgi:acylphosphatase
VERIACRVVVSGNVQGVFFRDSTRTVASRAGVHGWVRNAPDGTVEAHLEGASAAVDQVVSFMRAGPPHATVEQVDVSPASLENCRGFVVR